MDEQAKEAIRLPLIYVGMDEVPLLYGNHFAIQHSKGDFFLTVGQVQPPILLGSPQEREQIAKKLNYVPVKIVARVGISYDHIVELIQVLQKNVKAYETEKGSKSK